MIRRFRRIRFPFVCGAGLLGTVDTAPAPFDTAGSALTGRHPPAAREYSHLFRSEWRAYAPSFSLVFSGVQAIHERR